MEDNIKTLGVWAGVGAALGLGVALGLGLRVLAVGAAVGVGAGLALGAASRIAERRRHAPVGMRPVTEHPARH